MPEINSFQIVFSDVDVDALLAVEADLLIVESAYYTDQELFLTEDEIQLLEDDGKTVIAYVNVAVVDPNRDYWEEDWIFVDEERVSDLLCMSDPVHASPKGSMNDHLERNPRRTAEGRGAP